MIYKDQLNRDVTLAATPKRIISLVPSQTELLNYLGLEEELVGVTKFCIHPKHLRSEKIVVGGTKTIYLDKIADLNPDIIICNKEENTKDIVEACSKIAPVWVSDITTIDHNNDMILMLGQLLNKQLESKKLVLEINKQLASFKLFIKDKTLKKVAYCIWKNPYMVAGDDTFINSLLTLNKFENVFLNEFSRYPQIELNNLKKADLILLSSEPFPFKDEHVTKLKNELQCEVRLVNGDYFSWYGSRLKEAFSYFKTLHK